MKIGKTLGWLVLPALACFLAVGPVHGGIPLVVKSGDHVLGGPVVPGSTVTLTPDPAWVPEPTPPLQWFFNDQPIAGAKSTSLILANVTIAQTGNYRLRFVRSGKPVFSDTLPVNVVTPPPSAVDTTFTARLPADGRSYSLVTVSEDGRILLLSREDPVSHESAPKIVRLLPEGSLDSSFTFPATVGYVLAVQSDEALIVSNAPYRLGIDSTASGLTFPAAFDPATRLSWAAIQSDGRIVLNQGNLLARVNADGSPDATFNSVPLPALASSTNDIGNDTRRFITWVQVDARNRLLINYDEFYMDFFDGAIRRVLRLNSEGTIDSSFVGPGSDNGGGWSMIQPLPNGQLFALRYETDRYSLARLRDEGSIDPTYPISTVYAWDVAANGTLFRTEHYFTNLIQRIPTANAPTPEPAFYPGYPDVIEAPAVRKLLCQSDGTLLVAGSFTHWAGHASPGLVRLKGDAVAPPSPPIIDRVWPSADVRGGSRYTLDAGRIFGIGPFTFHWFGLDGQPLPTEITAATLTFDRMTATNLGRYQCRVTGPGGSTLGPVYDLQPYPGGEPRLINLSGRAAVGDGENTVIGGTVVQGNNASPMRLVVRGAGPTLASYGVSPALPDPVIKFFDQKSAVLATNSGWGNDLLLSTAFAALGAFPFPADSLDSALYRGSTVPGIYTVHLSSQYGRTGVGLMELYDYGDARPFDFRQPEREFQQTTVINLSLRARVGLGVETLIGGFVICDPENFDRPLKVLIRGVGPTLAGYGIQHPLADPKLTLFNATGAPLNSNDDWVQNADPVALAATMKAVGAFDLPAGSKDAALLLDLPAGLYTAHVTGADGGTGVALLEIYRVP